MINSTKNTIVFSFRSEPPWVHQPSVSIHITLPCSHLRWKAFVKNWKIRRKRHPQMLRVSWAEYRIAIYFADFFFRPNESIFLNVNII